MKKRQSNLLKLKKDLNLCPVCRRYYFSNTNSYEICPICNWEDDRLQTIDPNLKEGANKLSLNEARKAFKHG